MFPLKTVCKIIFSTYPPAAQNQHVVSMFLYFGVFQPQFLMSYESYDRGSIIKKECIRS